MADLAGFRAFLERRGLAPSTIDIYVGNVQKALEAGPVDRLLDDELAPKTKVPIRAALRHWAKYTKDGDLTEQLSELRLPPSRRKKAKVPLPRENLLDLVDASKAADPRVFANVADPVRGVIGLMACRGIRVGDVLRMHRAELANSLETGVLAFEAKGRRRLEFRVLPTFRWALELLHASPTKWSRVDQLIAPHAKPKGRRKAAARAIERQLCRIGVRLGILGIYPHRLRRTYAVLYLQQLSGDSEALIKLQQHMQWAGMQTALEYVDHVRGPEIDEPAKTMFDR